MCILAVVKCVQPPRQRWIVDGQTVTQEYSVMSAAGGSADRPGDMKRHKCAAERARPVEEQRGAVQCSVCQKWFRSKGGLAVHKCRTTG